MQTATPPFTGRIAWAHDVRTDPGLPSRVVSAWLLANGITTGQTVRIEITADRRIRSWHIPHLPTGCSCCLTRDDVYRNHLDGPHTTRLIEPLPPILTSRDGQ